MKVTRSTHYFKFRAYLERERQDLLEELAFDLPELQSAKNRGKIALIDELLALFRTEAPD